MAKSKKGTLPWDDLERIWMRDKTLREIRYEIIDGWWFVGQEEQPFAVLTPGKEEGVVHCQELQPDGTPRGPWLECPDKTQLIIQLNLAAASAHWRTKRGRALHARNYYRP